MIEIGGKPILWHIMKAYPFHGINDFVICCGYRGFVIKEYFANYFLYLSDVTFDMTANKMEVHQNSAEPWRVTLADTGDLTLTGGRLKRIRKYLGDEDFCFTYGVGVADIDVGALAVFHNRQGRMATVTSVQPPGRYGALETDGDLVKGFMEKPQGDGGRINGGYFVLSPKVIDYIDSDNTSWESGHLERLTKERQLAAFQHQGFWQPMYKNHLEELWQSGKAPWKVW